MAKLATILDTTGKVVRQPPFWVAVAATMARVHPHRGRPSAIRALFGYGAAGVVANLMLKPMFGRERPPGAGSLIRPPTSSFPSGHAACDTAFAVIAAREIPCLTVPMVALTTASHWSLWRTHSHYVSDILAGDAVGVALALAVRRLWATPTTGDQGSPALTVSHQA